MTANVRPYYIGIRKVEKIWIGIRDVFKKKTVDIE